MNRNIRLSDCGADASSREKRRVEEDAVYSADPLAQRLYHSAGAHRGHRWESNEPNSVHPCSILLADSYLKSDNVCAISTVPTIPQSKSRVGYCLAIHTAVGLVSGQASA